MNPWDPLYRVDFRTLTEWQRHQWNPEKLVDCAYLELGSGILHT